MSLIEQQAASNAWALARELRLPKVLRDCRRAGMSWEKTCGVLNECDGKINPWQYGNACIARWRADNG